MKEIDTKKVEQAVRMLLEALGDDPEREGLIETPKRVAKMYKEVFEGMCYTNDELALKYDKCFEDTTTGDLVVIGPVDVFSYCEHHMALMYDMQVYVGYIPNGKVIGLSKVARIADMCAKRLQLQERIGTDIYEVLMKILNTDDIIVVIEGSHSCMTARGIKKVGSKTKTASCNGIFMSNPALRQEFYNLIK
jgi:GTP cyclohydrolase I